MNNPLITIVTVCYNSEKTIKETIESVLNQTYTNIEYILVDGASKDSTIEIIRSYEEKFKDKRILYRWISEQDRGIYDAMNKAVQLINDDNTYVYFLNSDDRFMFNDTLSKAKLKINSEDFFYGRVLLEDKSNGYKIESGEKIKYSDLAYKNCPHQGSFTRKKVFNQYGSFNLEYKISSDYEFMVRIFKNDLISKKFIEETIAVMSMGGVSDYQFKISLKEKLKIIKKNYPCWIYIKSLFFIKIYEIPRNEVRSILTRFKIINIWRNVRDVFRT